MSKPKRPRSLADNEAKAVTRSIRVAGVYSGAFPMDDNASWERNAATLRRLHELRERVKALEKASQKNTP